MPYQTIINFLRMGLVPPLTVSADLYLKEKEIHGGLISHFDT